MSGMIGGGVKDLTNRRLFLFTVIAVGALSAGAFLIICAQKNSLGFPLDDAWIHQTYARRVGFDILLSMYEAHRSIFLSLLQANRNLQSAL